MDLVYADTCVYIDALDLNPEGSSDRLRPLKDLAWRFFDGVNIGKYRIVISDHVLAEFCKVIGSDKKLREFMVYYPDALWIKTEGIDKQVAKSLSRNYPDALHVVLALKGKAQILTTRNLRDFTEFEDKINIRLPESL
jgi:predicted nucleic acid-binding protein